MKIERRNYGRNHGYKLNGRKAPGVTTIVGCAPQSWALKRWRSKATAHFTADNWDRLAELPISARIEEMIHAADAERDQAARKGTLVHRLASRLIKGEELTIETAEQPGDIPEYLVGHVESYRKWAERNDVDPIAVELVVGNLRPFYCGTADLVAHLWGQVWLLELKTSASGLWPESAIQATGYRRASHYVIYGHGTEGRPLDGLGIERAGAVWIRADGVDLKPLDTGDRVWQYFRHLAWIQAHDEERAQWLGPMVDPYDSEPPPPFSAADSLLTTP